MDHRESVHSYHARRAIEETLASLRATGPEASASHAQLAAEHRRRAEQLFIREEAA